MEFIIGFLVVSVIVVAFILAYWILRPLFPVKVNCWFCNHDTKVPHGNKNCWDCPSCEQYNGFTQDGGYNKAVPAQWTEDINHPVTARPGEFLSRSQFLCHTCHRNQLLKIKQLAAFQPLSETTYDDEIAFYQRHLESVYALCLSCEAVVRREVTRMDQGLQHQQSQLNHASPGDRQSYGQLTFVQDPFYKRVSLLDLVSVTMSSAPVVCAALLFSTGLTRCFPLPSAVWLGGDLPWLGEELSVCLCGLLTCMLSKQLLGKERLYLGDAADILLWLTALLVWLCVTEGAHAAVGRGALGLAVALLGLDLGLALKHRHTTNATAPIMKRLSLDGLAAGVNSDAVSEAVSSVSTSCRRRLQSPTADADTSCRHRVASPLTDAGDSQEHPPSLATSFKTVAAPASGSLRGAGVGGKGEQSHGTSVARGGKGESLQGVDSLQQDLGAFLLGPPRSSESGYSSGRSSPFGFNLFTPSGDPSLSAGVSSLSAGVPSLSAGVPFPRPLISPARLSALSFSLSAASGTSAFYQPGRASPSTSSLFSKVPSENRDPPGRGNHYNIFLAQESRPLSMFLSADPKEARFKPSKPQPQGPAPKTSLLFSPLIDAKPSDSKPPPPDRAATDIDFSPLGPVLPDRAATDIDFSPLSPLQPDRAATDIDFSPLSPLRSCSPAGSWWRDSVTNTVSVREAGARGRGRVKDTASPRQQEIPRLLPVFPECDSTTQPSLADLKISGLCKKKKKSKSKPRQARDDSLNGFVFSDDEDEYVYPANLSSVSTVLVPTVTQGLGWLQWAAVAVVVLSVTSNMLLMWTLWASR